MTTSDLSDLEKRRIRLASAIAVGGEAAYPAEVLNALRLAEKVRRRIHTIESELPYESRTVVIPGRAGFGKIRLDLVCELIELLDGHVSEFQREHAVFRRGPVRLRWTARADRIDRIHAILPDFLADIDDAALAASRLHRAHLRDRQRDEHDPQWLDGLVRAYRRDYLDCYGRAMIARIALGVGASQGASLEGETASLERGRRAVNDAHGDAALADITRYQLEGPRKAFALSAGR